MPRRFAPRLTLVLLALLVAALAAGCVPTSYPVVLLNDTSEVVVAHPVSVQHQKSFTLEPNATVLRHLSNDTVGRRLTRADGTALGCLQPARLHHTGGLIFIEAGEADRVSLAHGACPAAGWFNFMHVYLTVVSVIPALPLVLGPLGAAVWLFVWARRRSRRVRLVAAGESLGLCGLSAVIALLLVRWGGP